MRTESMYYPFVFCSLTVVFCLCFITSHLIFSRNPTCQQLRREPATILIWFGWDKMVTCGGECSNLAHVNTQIATSRVFYPSVSSLVSRLEPRAEGPRSGMVGIRL